MTKGPPQKWLALLVLCGSASAASFELPEIPAPLRPLLDARILNAAPVISSLPAHPMGSVFLDDFIAFLVDGMGREKMDARAALRLVCTNYGDADLGIFALDCYVVRYGLADGFLEWLVEVHGDLRTSCRAQDWLVHAGQAPHPPAEGRGAVFAALRTAAVQPNASQAASDTLRAWSRAVDIVQKRSAGRQARAFLEIRPLTPINAVLVFDPVPPALLSALADALQTPAVLDWLTTLRLQSNDAALPPASLAPAAAAAALVAQYVAPTSASDAALQGLDAIVATLPEDVRAYLALPVAQKLIKQLDLNAAETRLEEASRLDNAGAWVAPIAMLRRQCRAGKTP